MTLSLSLSLSLTHTHTHTRYLAWYSPGTHCPTYYLLLGKIKRFGWRAASLTATLEGFRGSELDPCREGLTPVAPTHMSREAIAGMHETPKGLITSWPSDDSDVKHVAQDYTDAADR